MNFYTSSRLGNLIHVPADSHRKIVLLGKATLQCLLLKLITYVILCELTAIKHSTYVILCELTTSIARALNNVFGRNNFFLSAGPTCYLKTPTRKYRTIAVRMWRGKKYRKILHITRQCACRCTCMLLVCKAYTKICTSSRKLS